MAREDLAIVAAAYIAVDDLMPVALVGGAIFGGMAASDFAHHGIGAGARFPSIRPLLPQAAGG